MNELFNTLNPEAGCIPQPKDPREVAALIKASERSFRSFPYYILRFGERGRKFTYSDSGFIVTLLETPLENVIRQLKWLGKMLSNRGLPQYLLENHLIFLFEELTSAISEKKESHQKLKVAVEHLKEARRNVIPDPVSRQLDQHFNMNIGARLARRFNGGGMIIISAVADQKLDERNSVQSLYPWITDAARFPATWIEAAKDLFEKAEYHVQ